MFDVGLIVLREAVVYCSGVTDADPEYKVVRPQAQPTGMLLPTHQYPNTGEQ